MERKKLQAKVPADVHRGLKMFAAKQERSVETILTEIIEAALVSAQICYKTSVDNDSHHQLSLGFHEN